MDLSAHVDARLALLVSSGAVPASLIGYAEDVARAILRLDSARAARAAAACAAAVAQTNGSLEMAYTMVLAPFNTVVAELGRDREAIEYGKTFDLFAIERLQTVAVAAVADTFAQETAKAQSELNSDPGLKAQVAQLEALHKVNNAANSSLDLESVLQLTVQAVSEVAEADACAILLFEEATGDLVLQATKGLNPAAVGNARFRVGEGIAGIAALEGHPVAITNASTDPRFVSPPTLREDRYSSVLAVPIVLFTMGKLIGVLALYSVSDRSFGEEDIRFVETVCGQIAIAIENAKVHERVDEKLRQKVQEFATLQRVSALMASTLDLSRVLHVIAEQVMTLTGADASSIFRLREGDQVLTIIAAEGLSEEFVRRRRVEVGKGTLGQAVATGMPVVASAPEGMPELREFAGSDASADDIHKSVCCVPLVSKDHTIGGICVYRYEHKDFSFEQVQLLRAFASQAAIAIENAQLYEEAKRGLATKSALLREMHHRVKNNLQTIAALLSLQYRRTQSPEAAQPLGESISRIKSITAVHDLLAADQAGAIRVSDLVKRIVENSSVNMVPGAGKIDFVLGGLDVELDSKEATIVALLINELVANAIVHGLRGCEQGRISVEAKEVDGEIIVEVADNGRGLPSGFDLSRQSGLGLQIVQTLTANDLRGEFEIVPADPGTVAKVRFRRPEPVPVEAY